MFAPTSAASSAPLFPLPQKPTYSGSCVGGCNGDIAQFPNNTGLLRASFIPTAAATSSDNLLNATKTIFMYPAAGSAGSAGSTSLANTNVGSFVSGNCNAGNTPRYCVVDVAAGLSDLYLRLKAVYKPVAVNIEALDSGSNPIAIQGAQAVIDSTGKSQDVVRRIQVRVPLTPGYYYPEFAIESGDTICKRLAVYPGDAIIVAPTGSLPNATTNDGTKDQQACLIPGSSNTPSWPY